MKDGITQIRDPVHGYIYANELECKIIDSPVFQRLRKIRQLGTAHLTYPGALHTRFEHCIGSMYLAKRAANHLKSQEIINEDMSNELSIAALLHDIGHGPFSHLFEEVLHEKGMTHENITDRIIRETEIADILSRFGVNVKKFSNLCVGTSKNHPRFMNDIIAGFLSVDSMDYLLRDSYFSGVEYGKVDVGEIEIAKFQENIDSDFCNILDKPTSLADNWETARDSVSKTLQSCEITLKNVEHKSIWMGPIQGGKFLDLVEFSAKQLSKMNFDMYALGSPTEIMENYDYTLLAKMIITPPIFTIWKLPMMLPTLPG